MRYFLRQLSLLGHNAGFVLPAVRPGSAPASCQDPLQEIQTRRRRAHRLALLPPCRSRGATRAIPVLREVPRARSAKALISNGREGFLMFLMLTGAANGRAREPGYRMTTSFSYAV